MKQETNLQIIIPYQEKLGNYNQPVQLPDSISLYHTKKN